jgi:hypothetical protein
MKPRRCRWSSPTALLMLPAGGRSVSSELLRNSSPKRCSNSSRECAVGSAKQRREDGLAEPLAHPDALLDRRSTSDARSNFGSLTRAEILLALGLVQGARDRCGCEVV